MQTLHEPVVKRIETSMMPYTHPVRIYYLDRKVDVVVSAGPGEMRMKHETDE